MPGAVYIEYDVQIGKRTGSFRARLGGATDPFAFGATTDLTVNINQNELEAFRDAVWGSDKLANIWVPRYRIVYESADAANTVTTPMPASMYWKVAVSQGANNFLLRLPGGLTDDALRAVGSATYANLNAARWQAVIGLAQSSPYLFCNPDKTLVVSNTAQWSAAQLIDAGRRPPRENISSSNV